MAETFDPTVIQVIPAASGTTKKGEPKPLTPLQRKVDVTGSTVAPEGLVAQPLPGSSFEPLPRQVEAQKHAMQVLSEEGEATPTWDAFAESAGGITRDLFRVATQEEGAKGVDPKYDRGANRQAFRSKYGEEHWDEYERTVNQSQQDMLIARLEEQVRREGVMGESLTGTLTGAVLDPIGMLTGGAALKGAIKAAQVYKLGKPTALAVGATAEAGTYAGIEAGVQSAEFGEVYDPQRVAATFAIAGALHFGIGALVTPKSLYQGKPSTESALLTPDTPAGNPHTVVDVEAEVLGGELIQQARRELSDDMQARVDAYDFPGEAPQERYFSEDTYPPKPPEEESLAAAGADANSSRSAALDGNIITSHSDNVNDVIELATVDMQAKVGAVGQEAFDWLQTGVGRVASTLSNTLQGLGSKSPVVQSWALRLGADPTGRFRAIEHATAYDKERYNELIRNHYSRVHDEYLGWLSRQGKRGSVARITGAHEAEFNKLLRKEMEARWNSKDYAPDEIKALDEARWRNTPPEVRRAADALDAGGQEALNLMKKYEVLGADGLNDISRGYVPRRMNGRALQELHRLDPERYKQLREGLGRRYYTSFVANQRALIAEGAEGVKLITPEKAQTIADGVIERAINRASGVDGSTIGLLDRAARDEIRSILESKGADYTDIEHTFNLLDKRLGTRTGSNRLKGRMEVDISTPDELTGIDFLDYFDNDLNRLTSSYAEEMSGRIALARQGISSDNDFEKVINAVKNENKSEDVAKDIQLLRDMYARMLGRPLQGQGENKAVQFLTQLNPLQALGQVGAAQFTESSLSVARMGMGAMLKAVPIFAKVLVGARKNLLSEGDVKLLKDIEAWNGPIGEHWRTRRPSTDVMERLNSDGTISHMADRLLKAGQHINGFVSLMHQVMEAQLKVVAISGTRTFAKEIMQGSLTKRLADAGFSDASVASIRKELEKHAVYKDGELYDLQLSKWAHNNADDFTRNLERLSGQLIQRDFAGETASWMHKDLGRMLLSLRGYSVKAFNKQLVRNLSIRDAVAAQSVVYGLFFSTAGYTAKMHALSLGREDKEQFLEDRLTGDALVQGAVGYMALGAFAPELLRPMASWAGEGSGESGAIRGGGNALVAAVPGLAPVYRAMTTLDNIGSSTIGDSEWSARRTRQALSNVSNSFPIALAINAAIDDDE